MNKSYKIDIPVALIFFNRDDTLAAVFEQIKMAKPSKLFLIQDGARKNNSNDEEKIISCRKIVEDIDWNCEVYKTMQMKIWVVASVLRVEFHGRLSMLIN